ncbi:MAG: tetratricopeptide repeat protein [Candidatus Krumholzibacteriia bacterium]
MTPKPRRPDGSQADKKTPRRAARRATEHVPGGGSRRPPRRRGWLETPARPALVVFLVAFALYANTIGHGFVWDDVPIIVKNEAIRTLDAPTVKNIFTQEFVTAPHRKGGYYRPLVTLSYHVDYKLSGASPVGFHVTNVLLNAVVCVLVFLFLWLLFRHTGIAFVSALLFAVHPAHTENVAWVAGRTDVLATLWMLVSLICYVVFRRRGRKAVLAVSLVAFCLALLSKELAACLVPVVALLELGVFPRLAAYRPGKVDGARGTRGALVPPLLFAIVLAFYLLARHAAIGTFTTEHSPVAPGAAGRIALPLAVLAGYVFKVFFPARLNAEWDVPVPESLAQPYVILGTVSLALLVWSVRRLRHRPAVVLGTGIFLVGIGPVLHLIPIGEISADRFLYFPSLGAALVLGWVFTGTLSQRHAAFGPPAGELRSSRSLRGPLALLLAAALAAGAARTVTRNGDWKNNTVFYARTVAQAPENPRAHVNVGNLARENGDARAAALAYATAIRLDPNHAEALNNLAGIYASRGQYDEAVPLMERALQSWADNAPLHINLGSIYLLRKEYAKAEQRLDEALAIDPGDSRAHFVLGLVLVEQEKFGPARPHFRRAADGGPEFHKAYYHLAVIEKALGNAGLAGRYARRFLAAYTADDDLRRTARAIAGE